jgi:hypothetical protein
VHQRPNERANKAYEWQANPNMTWVPTCSPHSARSPPRSLYGDGGGRNKRPIAVSSCQLLPAQMCVTTKRKESLCTMEALGKKFETAFSDTHSLYTPATTITTTARIPTCREHSTVQHSMGTGIYSILQYKDHLWERLSSPYWNLSY